MLAAEHAKPRQSRAGRANDELTAYEDAWRASDIGKDLKKAQCQAAVVALRTLPASAMARHVTNTLFGFHYSAR